MSLLVEVEVEVVRGNFGPTVSEAGTAAIEEGCGEMSLEVVGVVGGGVAGVRAGRKNCAEGAAATASSAVVVTVTMAVVPESAAAAAEVTVVDKGEDEEEGVVVPGSTAAVEKMGTEAEAEAEAEAEVDVLMVEVEVKIGGVGRVGSRSTTGLAELGSGSPRDGVAGY